MNKATLILLAGLVCGCSGNDDSKTENVFQGQVDSLHKAQGVEKTLMDADMRQREMIEKAE